MPCSRLTHHAFAHTRRDPLGGLDVFPSEILEMVLLLVAAPRLLRQVCRTTRNFVDTRVKSLTITVLQSDKRCPRMRQESVRDLTDAAVRFPALRHLTIGTFKAPNGVRKVFMEGALLSDLLSAAPHSLSDVTLHRCRLSDRDVTALTAFPRLHLELDVTDADRQVVPLRASLRSLTLVNKTPLASTAFLAKLTALESLSMPCQRVGSDAIMAMPRLESLTVSGCDKDTLIPAALKRVQLCDPELKYYRAPYFLANDVALTARMVIDDTLPDPITMLMRVHYWRQRAVANPATLSLDVRMNLTAKPHYTAGWFKYLKFAQCVHRLQLEKDEVHITEVMALFTCLPSVKDLVIVGAIDAVTVRMVKDLKKTLPHYRLRISGRAKKTVQLKSTNGEPYGPAFSAAVKALVAQWDTAAVV